ncbi:pentapeptide repeat-containing protein [Nocardiopsis sp. LDBS1602]|uniref:pentapeptide repeat-containing protein n=1 Tax=Nocardiopsis sp. LDBS1602 TaxID=3109597 RepID=UPI002DB84621|nr:pentapeptide repeat-containing protein [Nocardiopsis sp. LDBS1602]MEC3893522.1 pentapeptide repeat-containing protein [Nocardiopsis sp. LDBS1602]
MFDYHGERLQNPTAWPTDPTAKEILREYVVFINSKDGSHGSELSGPYDFRGADLRKFQMQWQFLWGSNFSGVILDGADLYKAEMVEVVLREASLKDANLHKADISACEAQRASFAGANLLNTDLSESDLREADFKEVWAGGTLFFNSDLRGADFRRARFGTEKAGVWTDFSGAKIGGALFSGVEGTVLGPIDVGEKSRSILDGLDLEKWFADQGAPEVRVRKLKKRMTPDRHPQA